jgi:transposase
MELLSQLLPVPLGLQLEAWHVDQAEAEIVLTLTSRQATTRCPVCTMPARRVHSRYRRTLADLPWGRYAVRLGLGVRKLFCDHAGCTRRIFTERLPEVAAPWARRTARLAERLTAVGLALGGSAGARLSRGLAMPTTRNTLLRLIRAAPLPPEATPSVLGIDDWARRKRHRYGTVLIDLERRRPVALLPDREADTLAAWLQAHPGVEVVARDRAGAYADGTRRGAPDAVQVADRFHLLQNLAETLETVFTGHAAGLRAVERGERRAEPSTPAGVVRPVRPQPGATARAKAAERRERRLAQHRQVWALHREGWPGHAIARQLGISRSTVFRCLRTEVFPERKARRDAGRSLLAPWKPFLLERWNAGHRGSRRLLRELQQQGYRGSYATLARYTQRLRQAQEGEGPTRRPSAPAHKRVVAPVMDPPPRALTPRTAAWLVLRRPERRDTDATTRLTRLRAPHAELAEAIELGEAFARLIRAGHPDRLDPWLARAQDGALPAFRGFAKRLRVDEEAVRAAATLPWSTGQVEGQINRLKMIKRQMYGRANLDLLGRRFLLAA